MKKKNLMQDFSDISLKISTEDGGRFSPSFHVAKPEDHEDKPDNDDLFMLSLRGLLMGEDSASFNGGRRCRLRLLFQLAMMNEKKQSEYGQGIAKLHKMIFDMQLDSMQHILQGDQHCDHFVPVLPWVSYTLGR